MLAGKSKRPYFYKTTGSLLERRWLPIMQAYEQGTAAYFATPPVNLIYAFCASLAHIVDESPSLDERFRLHREAAKRVRQVVTDLGLKQAGLIRWL